MISKERVVQTRSIQDIEKLINKMTQGKSISVSNYNEKRDFSADTGTLGDLSNLVATLINDLKNKGIIGG